MDTPLDIVGIGLMAVITFPLSFLIARACLKGVLRVVSATERNPARLAR